MHIGKQEFFLTVFFFLSLTASACSISYLERPGRTVNDKSVRAKAVIGNRTSRDAILEKEGTGLDFDRSLNTARRVDKRLLRERILQAKEYLLRVIDHERHGVHKYYYAETDTFEPRLHTLYTSSVVFTLLKIYRIDADPRIEEKVSRCGDFILSMQSKEMPGTKSYGAFHYSYDIRTRKADRLYVVGTSAKTIFTLLELYRFTGEPRYLESARMAAQWLLTMQRPNGTVTSSLRQDQNGGWHHEGKFSFLYTGQVLSALSRMYLATGEHVYLHGAGKIGGDIEALLPPNRGYVGDDYRKPNPVSSSWAVRSLLDFSEASGDARFENIAFTYGGALAGHQIQDVEDMDRFGRWEGSRTTSGNGWLNEVMSELYLRCRERGMEDCRKYKDAMVRGALWILQHICSDENMDGAKNPVMARGGVFWSARNRYIRTDSVCHCINAFVNMLDHLEEGLLMDIPEVPPRNTPVLE
ncbi:MAG: glycoside hydrolase family 76 protein [Deltaproteobacteria bacterium]